MAIVCRIGRRYYGTLPVQSKLNLELVKAAALLKGLNLTEVAARVGVSVESVSKWWHPPAGRGAGSVL